MSNIDIKIQEIPKYFDFFLPLAGVEAYHIKKLISFMIKIDRTEIETWGKEFDAKGNFPKLIAKLIRETTPKSTTLQVPSG